MTPSSHVSAHGTFSGCCTMSGPRRHQLGARAHCRDGAELRQPNCMIFLPGSVARHIDHAISGRANLVLNTPSVPGVVKNFRGTNNAAECSLYPRLAAPFRYV